MMKNDNEFSASYERRSTPLNGPNQGKKRGWHAHNLHAPRRGKGSATVSPIKRTGDIEKIKVSLIDAPRDLSLFMVGIHTGLRGSDLLTLRWSDILSVDGGTVEERVTLTEQKTGNTRHVALNEKVRHLLQTWHQASRTLRGGSNYVWPNPRGGCLTIQRLHQLVNRWCKSAGVRGHFGTHTLRKTYGYHLRRLGHDIELLMKIFGHSSASITLRYIGVEQEQIDEANLKLAL